MNKTLASLLALALVPTALAHFPPGTSNPTCEPEESLHDYHVGMNVQAGAIGLGFTTVSDGCESEDGEYEHGIGGAFLPSSHHEDTICVADAALGDVTFSVGTDGNGDGAVTDHPADTLVHGAGCVDAGGPPGVDGGWWVFLAGAATAGHAWTT